MRGTLEGIPHSLPRIGIIPAYAGNTNRRGESDADARDHPRVCGEHDTPGARGRARTGSSPRMRGTHDGSAVFVPRHGIIPAYAGNTCAIKGGTSYDWDHPRVCGEHMSRILVCSSTPGSSPRMRGTHRTCAIQWCPHGIIPAYAGNTRWTRPPATLRRDHPRVCGEHPNRPGWHRLLQGSSPRMRGTPCSSPRRARSTGIIPAYAGNTRTPPTRPPLRWDHPRVCGEHLTENEAHRAGEGSSPRMRGTRSCPGLRCRCLGIIPAYAGNTTSRATCRRSARDHPRVCGEHPDNALLSESMSGSSPRMRGTLCRHRNACFLIGIIPAYAGNTLQRHGMLAAYRDHPRVCGEHTLPETLGRSRTGSSPRMRGTRIESLAGRFGRGIIPAYAGNTALSILRLRAPWDHPRVCGEHRLKG